MRLLILLLAGASYAQVASKAAVVTVHAGTSTCTFTNYRPMTLTGVHVECVGAAASTKQDVVIAVGLAGMRGQFSEGADVISWTLQRPAADGPLLYKVTANGKAETGSL